MAHHRIRRRGRKLIHQPPTPPSPEEIERRIVLLRAEFLANIEQHGFAVRGVFPTEALEHPPFNYTVGIAKTWGLPELIVSGVNMEVASHLFWSVVDRIKAGNPVQPDVPIEEIAGVPVVFKRCPKQGLVMERMTGAVNIHGDRPWEVLQLVWPDPQGFFPWDADYDVTMPQELYYLSAPEEP